MDEARPAPGEELNLDAPTTPRRAATVILLKGGGDALEVLLVQRNPAARFMGGAWVFPGGAVHADDGEGDVALRCAAVREVREEAGIELGDPGELVPFSRWITPAEVKIRFDTYFYLAPVPDAATARIDGAEVVDARWCTPGDALAAAAREELMLVFPTIKHLEQISPFQSATELLRFASERDVMPVQPRVVVQGETARIVLPGEPGYTP